MSLRIFVFLICCIMFGCIRAAPANLPSIPSPSTAEATTATPLSRSSSSIPSPSTAEATTATKEPIQPAVTCNVDQELPIDSSKSILGDIPVPGIPDHSIQVLNRRYIPLKTCKELYHDGFAKSGLYVVKPCKCGSEFVVYCDMNLHGGGWTIIQRRVNDNVSFRRNYKTYQNGFGDFTENFWLGLDKLHCLTESADLNNELYIGLDSFYDDRSSRALYGSFSVGNEEKGYLLRVGQFNGSFSNAGDSMKTHNSLQFSTYDNDQDEVEFNCAEISKGGWWYNNCGNANLNGKYYPGGTSKPLSGMIWDTWLGNLYSVKTTIIAIRPTQ